MLKYLNGIGTNPNVSPINVNGIAIATMLKIIEVAYTALDALLCMNGAFAVLTI